MAYTGRYVVKQNETKLFIISVNLLSAYSVVRRHNISSDFLINMNP